MTSRPNTWTHINLALSIEVKDTNWFLDKTRTDQWAGDWSPKVIPRFMTDRIAKKPMQCLRWKRAFEGLEHSVLADILGKWHRDFSILVCWMISAYRVQMYTQHRAFVRKARQASCKLGKKLMHTGAHSIHTFSLWSHMASFCYQLWGFSKPTPSEKERADNWQVPLIQAEMVNPNVKSCCNICGIWKAHMRPTLCFLFSYDVPPASLAQLHYRCAVCHTDDMHFLHSVKYCILCHSAQNPVRQMAR